MTERGVMLILNLMTMTQSFEASLSSLKWAMEQKSKSKAKYELSFSNANLHAFQNRPKLTQ